MNAIEELLSHRSEIDAELRKHKSPVTVMLTDWTGSGGNAATASTDEHYKIISAFVQQRKGVVVKTIGDSLMACFTDPAQAVACGVDIQKATEANNAGRANNEQMHARVALHHGLAYLRGADVFGDVVNMTARIAKSCLPAQILVSEASEALYLSAQQAVTLPFKPGGTLQFNGKSGVEKLYEIIWTDETAYQKLRDLFPAQPQPSTQENAGNGRYMMVNELGRGAMGMVYKAYDRHIGRMVAMKTISLEVDEKEKQEVVARLKQEAHAAGILDHPNIVTVYDVGEEAGVFYFTMQYVEGTTLASVRAEKKLLPLEQVLDIMEQVLSAIGFAHQRGIIHRDIKPSNLMLTSQGTTKVMDFGIAKFGGNVGLTQAGVVVGTPSYLAPEQAAGRRIDTRADIFALGSVFYELLTAEKAFPGESTTSILFKILNEEPVPPRVIEPSLPPALDAIVRKALAKDPNQRFQTCEEMRAAVRGCRKNPNLAVTFAAAPITRKPIVSGKTAIKPPKTRKPVWTIVATVIVLLAAAAGFVFMQNEGITWPALVAAARGPAPAPPTPKPIAAPPFQTEPRASQLPDPAETNLGESAAKPPDNEETAANKETPPAPDERTRNQAVKPQAKGTTSVRKNAGSLRSARVADAPRGGGDSSLAGFDTPTLLRIADNYSGKGEYRKAVYIYRQVLLRDSRNIAAKQGLRRAQDAQGVSQ